MKAPRKVQLVRSDRTNIHHEFSWFVVPHDDYIPVFSPKQSGDSALKACLTWIEKRGYRPASDDPSEEWFVR